MADKYLSLSGVNYLWGKIKDEISASAGGGDALIVAFKWGGTNNNTKTCSHTFAEIKAAYDAKKPVIAVYRLTANNRNSCVLYISNATSSSILFDGAYVPNNDNAINRIYVTLSSSNVVNVYDNKTVVSKITNTNQLTNGGPPNASWWTQYATNNDVADHVRNSLYYKNPDGSTEGPIIQIYGEPGGPWTVGFSGYWTDQYGGQHDMSTFSDLYSWLCSGDGGYFTSGNTIPVIMHEYQASGMDALSPVVADYPNTYSSSFETFQAYENYYFFVTLTSMKSIYYQDSNYEEHYAYTFVFSTTDIRLEDKATILRTFILQGEMYDTIDQSTIEIRDSVIQSAASPLYYYKLPDPEE